jgi:acyl-CoA thioester hydrolase
MSPEPPAQFQLAIGVRSYEVDVNGHVNHAVYHQYAEHARMEHFRAAGLSQARLAEYGATIVLLATTVNFRSELLAGEQLTVDSELAFGEGRAFTMRHRIVRTVDTEGQPAGDVLAADVDCTMGVMDLTTRKLLHGPRDRLAAVASRVELLDPVRG